MTSSWKIGAVSGLIAGIVAGIIGALIAIIYVYAGLPFNPHASNIADIPTFVTITITLTIIWGIILGAIYSRAHEVISDKIIKKGLLYGLFCALIFPIRDAFFLTSYFYIDSLTSINMVIYALVVWIPFGIILATLYGRWCKDGKQEIVTYDMKSGINPGAIAGLIAGVLASFIDTFYVYIGLYPAASPTYFTDINLILSVFGTHIFIHLIYGAFWGAVFARAYNIIPKKGIVKGLCYGLILFLISAFQITTWYVSIGLAFNDVFSQIWGVVFTIFDIFVLPLYGLVLGYLYRKPSE
ncbi:hypothetical protein [[Eubacterium] cellulosolvens]